jgi:NADH:ubiquinone oxidoreductase subunit D
MVEAPRGIAVCYVVSDGTAKPYRVKWRTPSFSAVQILPELIKDRYYSDLMPIFGSLDVVLPEVDR